MKKLLCTLFCIAALFGVSAYADSEYILPVLQNPYGEFVLSAQFGDCIYSVDYDGILNRINTLTETSDMLLYDVDYFITDGNNIYFSSLYEDRPGIYRFNIRALTLEHVLDTDGAIPCGCWRDKYLYYELSDEDGTQAFIYDLENGTEELWFSKSLMQLKTCGDKIYYMPDNGNSFVSDIYVSNPDGSDAAVLIKNVIDFDIFDGELYYAECSKEYGSGMCDFQIKKTDMNAANSEPMSEFFTKKRLYRIGKNKALLDTGELLENAPYPAENVDGEYKIDFQINEDGSVEQGILRAYRGGLLWEFKTERLMRTELELISDAYHNDDAIYLAAGGILYAIDSETGNIKWKAQNVGGGNRMEFDGYGNVYISGYYGPNLAVFTKDGAELYRDNDESYGWVYDLQIVGNVLNISYGREGENTEAEKVRVLDISQFYPSRIYVSVNGNDVVFDQEPVIEEGRTLVPLRAIFEALGASVNWNDETKTVTSEMSGINVSLTIGDGRIFVNGRAKELDVAARIIGGRTMVPARAVSEAFGCSVGWDGKERRVIITSGNQEKGSVLNERLASCIGKTKAEIIGVYGPVNASEFLGGGRYYTHSNLKSELFYNKNEYNYNVIDDLSDSDTCGMILAYISELTDNPDKTEYSPDELSALFGSYEKQVEPESDFTVGYTSYKYHFGGYTFYAELGTGEEKMEYIFVWKD